MHNKVIKFLFKNMKLLTYYLVIYVAFVILLLFFLNNDEILALKLTDFKPVILYCHLLICLQLQLIS